MIQRIVLLKLDQNHATDAAREAVAVHSREVLASLPGVLAVEVGVAAEDATARSWDLSLVLRFASSEDLEPYRLHPRHRSYVDEYLKPMLEGIVAWNFAIPS